MKQMEQYSYFRQSWRRFLGHRLGAAALFVVFLFCVTGIYAPLLASSKPLFLIYDGVGYFPLFRYLFYSGFYTKPIDIFFNIGMFSFPLILLSCLVLKRHPKILKGTVAFILLTHVALFFHYGFQKPRDPAVNISLSQQRHEALQKIHQQPSWDFELQYMTPYAKLNAILRYRKHLAQHQKILEYAKQSGVKDLVSIPTLWRVQQINEEEQLKSGLGYIQDKQRWLEEQSGKIQGEVMPLFRPFHWEDDAGGEQSMNDFLPWWELTRINQKDLTAGLIFGVRISLVVGLLAVSLAMAIGVPIGALAGYYGGTFDIIVSRLLEIWESMPTFFMLLLVVSMTQSKSIFLVIAVVGIFGWTSFSRYIRGEFFKQRNLSYVEAGHALGFRDSHIMFSHILPNAIPPVLTLLPFAIMGAITSEAGLSFLGLGEEGSCSWGVLMDEGRSAFPGESYLLWPPALLLTILLVAIALVGDALRDTLDPKMHR